PSGCHLYLHSFPTRRSSDLVCIVGSGDSWTVALCAAAWLGKYTHLFCSALQTWDFLQTDLTRYQKETLIIILSASGRPSLTVDADRKSTRLNSSHVSISYAV